MTMASTPSLNASSRATLIASPLRPPESRYGSSPLSAAMCPPDPHGRCRPGSRATSQSITSTGTSVKWRTFCVTLPSSMPGSPDRPREPITMRSAPKSCAWITISWAVRR
jgi:hypothetical protein